MLCAMYIVCVNLGNASFGAKPGVPLGYCCHLLAKRTNRGSSSKVGVVVGYCTELQ